MPRAVSVPLDGSNVRDVPVPEYARSVAISPETLTVDVQFSFRFGEANTTGEFGQLLDGEGIALDRIWKDDDRKELSLFAGSAVNVTVVFF